MNQLVLAHFIEIHYLMIMKEQLSPGTKLLNFFLGITVISLVVILVSVVVALILSLLGVI